MGRPIAVLLLVLVGQAAEARLARLRIERREVLLEGRPFGLAGPYEKLVGKVDFALDPALPANRAVVDLGLAPRNEQGEVEFEADFYLLKPVDPARGNGVLFYEAGNRGRKRILSVFQDGPPSEDPTTAADFGNGSLMVQGFSLLWMGWQWDVPEGRMRMEMPIATKDGVPITGLVRANFIPGERGTTASLADRGHRAYPVVDPEHSEHQMLVRARPFDAPSIVPRASFRFPDASTVVLDRGFEPGLIYDVVYRSVDPRVVGCGLAGTRDLVSFFKHERGEENPLPGIRWTIGWGVSQTGRFLRHFLYQGFNADENGRQVFDGLIDQVGGAGRGSFNHRFGQASRDTLQHFNLLYPVDLFPFTDGAEKDLDGREDGLLRRAQETGTVPKLFHILTNSEYFNRAGSLVLTDPLGARDTTIPETSRVYSIAGAPHIVGSFPPGPNPDAAFLGRAPMNPLDYDPVVRALFRAMVLWLSQGTPPPESAHPRIADGTLTRPERAGWPAVPGFSIPLEPQTPRKLDFGPSWDSGIVDFEPPRAGDPYVVLVPGVDEDGNDLAGIRLPEIEVPLATHTGWNYRHPSIGAPDRLASEIGSYLAFPRTREERERSGDPRRSIDERYPDRSAYLGRITEAALRLLQRRYLLVEDLPAVVARARAHYDWATRAE